MSKKTLAEQIREFEATRQAKAARMAEIMEKSAEDGETLDDEQTEEYDGLKGEVKSIDDHLVRLRDLETINAAAAKPVGEVKTLEDGAAARGGNGRVSVRAAALPPGIRFARVVKCLGMAKGHLGEAVHLAEHHYSDDQAVVGVLKGAQRVGKLDQDMITRAAVGAMASSHAQGGGALISDESGVFADFVEFLRAMTILGRFGTGDYPSLRRVPFRTPLISQTSGGDAYWTGEGMGKGLTNFDFERTTLEPLKAANICVVTEEVLRDSSPSADMLVRDSLASALRERLDIDFINPNKTAVANISPAGITNGVTAIASSGTDADAVRADIGALLAAFVAANNPPTDGVLIMTSIRAMNLSLMRNALGQKEFPDITLRGGMLEGLPVMTSQYVPDTGSPAFSYVILVNASDVYFADEGGIAIDMSREASLQMDSAPTMTAHGAGSPGTATATSVVSLWQTNTVGFRAERTVNWARRRASGVQVLSGVAWRPTVS